MESVRGFFQAGSFDDSPGYSFLYFFLIKLNFMKINFLYFFLVLIVIHPIESKAQDYLPLLNENLLWSVMHEKHTLLGDTTINEVTYKKLYFHNYLEEFTPTDLQYLAAMREDTIEKKVYFVWKGYEEEVLLYDFSLEVGSEFEVNSPVFWQWGPEFYPAPRDYSVIVMEVFFQEIAGINRRTLKLEATLNPFFLTEYWIEGLGSTQGLIYPGTTGDLVPGRPSTYLLCVHEDSLLIYQGIDPPWGNFVDTCYFEPALKTEDAEHKIFEIIATPSIFNDRFSIQSNRYLNNIRVLNVSGQIIYEYNSTVPFLKKTINASHWQKGFYIVIAGNSFSRETIKIIKY